MKYLHIRITDLLEEKGISKTRICKDLELQRGNFNRYCRDDFQRAIIFTARSPTCWRSGMTETDSRRRMRERRNTRI